MMLENCDVFCNEIEKLSLPELEEKIKGLYKEFKKSNNYLDERLYFYLWHRSDIINQNFKFTPNVVKHIERINSMLMESTVKVLKRTNLLYQQMTQIKAQGDDFLDDFEVEGSVSIEYLNKDSLLILDEDENNGQSDYVAMADVLDFTQTIFRNLSSFSISYKSDEPANETNDNYAIDYTLDLNWNIDILSAPELRGIQYICHASHVLFTDTHYSISDIIRIKNICNEVKVIHRNIKF